MPPYNPGRPPQRTYTGYSAYQEFLWQALDTVYQAYYHGHSETCQPTPGEPVDMKRFLEWHPRFDTAWSSEAGRDGNTRGLTAKELGRSTMLHLYERLNRAAGTRDTSHGSL